MNTKMHRRALLRGLGASAALLSPVVRSVVAQAQGQASGGNLVVFYTPNGFRRTYFGADGTETNFTMRPTTAVLESQKSDLVVFRNINNMAYPGTTRSHNCISRILTCKAGSESTNTVAAGPSIDHVIAGHYNQNPLVLAVQPQRKDFTWHTQLSWAAAGSAKRGLTDSKAVFGDLFGSSVQNTNDVDAARLNRRNKSVLDAVRSEITTLRGRLDGDGKAKLDLHMNTVRELEQSITRSEVGEMMCELGMLQSKSQAALPTVPSGTPMSSKAYTPLLQAHGELQMDLITAALACGQRKVATLIWQECSWEGVNVNGVDANDSHHNVSHYDLDTTVSGDGLAQLLDIEKFYAARFASMLNKLRTAGILDNTIVVWVTEVRESHDQGEFTWIAAGGKNLGIRTGRYHNFPYQGPHNDPRKYDTNRTVSDLWVSVKKALGVPGDTFGDAQWCHGGLQEYFAG